MTTSFITYWPSSYISQLKKSGDIGASLEVIFGGGHNSFPAPATYGASPGDLIYVITVARKTLHILACLEVTQIISIAEYTRDVLKLPKRLHQLHLFDLTQELLDERPELGHRIPHHCVNEAVTGKGTPITLDCTVPPQVLGKLRLENRKGERRPISHVENGELMRSIGLQQHVYRLSPDSAKRFSNLVHRK